MARLPLEGIRVVEITVVLAGTYATRPLADWGAEVIRVESRQHFQYGTRGAVAHPKAITFAVKGGGSLMSAPPGRIPGPRPWNQYPSFNTHSRNKLSMTVDVTRPEGLDIFKRLIKVSDAFIENNAFGTLAKYGITYDTLREVKPDIIYVSMPGFGSTGPYREYRCFGIHLETFCGHLTLKGYTDTDMTTQSRSNHCDTTSANSACVAILLALRHRRRTGEGQFIDMAQVETFGAQFAGAIMDYTMNQWIQGSLSNRDPSAIQGCYRCAGEDPSGQGRWVNITIFNDEQWQGFCRAIGNPAWTKEERFNDVVSRYKNHDELDKLIEAWTSQHDNFEIMHILQKEGVPAAPVMNEIDVLNDPHVKERGFLQLVSHADCGTTLHPGLSYKMSKTPNGIRRPPCLLGEHNEYVYKQVIGVSDAEYAALEKAGHIGMDYTPGVK